jgi:uncharacterized protein (TIGR03118 family)
LLESRQFLSAGHNFGQFFVQTNLVSDSQIAASAAHTDPNLKNPWGLASSPTGPWWVANNHTGMSTIYDHSGNTFLPAVQVPGAGGATGNPTGIVFNGGSEFQISANGKSGPARFIFVNEDGLISGWNSQVDSAHAVPSGAISQAGASYKGVTLAQFAGNTYLYAADFHNGDIAIFDSSFHSVTMPGSFTDSKLPAGFAPFNVQNVGGHVFVTYAMQDADKADEVAGAGLGYVDEYSAGGKLMQRFQTGSFMNAPWGVVQAPKGFGKFTGDILIGMFGSGQIAAFNAQNGKFQELLRDVHDKPIQIDGLWALRFGNNGVAGDDHTLFFTAGINDEDDGLFGTLTLNHGKPKSRG